jgi:peptide/nickel transport system permease protein
MEVETPGSSSTGGPAEGTGGTAPSVPHYVAGMNAAELDLVSPRASIGYWQRAWRRFRRDRFALAGAAIVLLLVVVAVFASRIAPYDPSYEDPNGLTMLGAPLPPSPGHWLGTDTNGRDALSRIIYGAQVSLLVGLVGNGFAGLIGLVAGSLAGYYRGWVDTVVSRIIDIFLAFPVYLLALALVAVLTPSVQTVIGIIVVAYWTTSARIIRGQVISLRERDFVEAARSLGQSERIILIRHIYPHILATLVVYVTLSIASTVVFESGLTYLGVGVPHGTPSWGGTISDNQQALTTAPWLVFGPSAAIMLTVLAFNLLGDGLRDALDPYRE